MNRYCEYGACQEHASALVPFIGPRTGFQLKAIPACETHLRMFAAEQIEMERASLKEGPVGDIDEFGNVRI